MTFGHSLELKNQDTQPIIPTQVILHSLGNGYSWLGGLGWLRDPNNPLEAHVCIRQDGFRVQLVPYTVRADANYRANRRPDGTGAIAVETDSSIQATEPWTADQVASIVELLVELCRRFAIPPRLCRSPDDPGIGWHIMFGSPGAWTPSAKVCPGPARIAQVPGIVALVAQQLVGPGPDPVRPPTTTQEELLMALSQYDQELIRNAVVDTNNRTAALEAKVDALIAVLHVQSTDPRFNGIPYPKATHDAVGVVIGQLTALPGKLKK